MSMTVISPINSQNAAKYNTFRSDIKRSKKAGAQSGYINHLFPTMQDKVQALIHASYYEDEEEMESIADELEMIGYFDPWNFMIYIQSLASDLTELAMRAFKTMLELMKTQKKEPPLKTADPVNMKDYDFEFEGNFEPKSYVKGKMKVKRYDKSFSRDKKGQSDMMKELNERVIASERGKPEKEAQTKAEKSRTESSNQAAAQSMAGEGGYSNMSWDSGGGDHFTACEPSFGFGFGNEM